MTMIKPKTMALNSNVAKLTADVVGNVVMVDLFLICLFLRIFVLSFLCLVVLIICFCCCLGLVARARPTSNYRANTNLGENHTLTEWIYKT